MLNQLAQYYRTQGGPMMDYGHDDGIGWIFLVGFVVIALIVGAALFITYKAATKTTAIQENPAQDPLAIAKERLAKGEITKEEFADIKKALAE